MKALIGFVAATGAGALLVVALLEGLLEGGEGPWGAWDVGFLVWSLLPVAVFGLAWWRGALPTRVAHLAVLVAYCGLFADAAWSDSIDAQHALFVIWLPLYALAAQALLWLAATGMSRAVRLSRGGG